MGKLENGAFGGFSGKVGSVVGSKWRNQNIIRSRPTGRKKDATTPQLAQQQKLQIVGRFLTPVKTIVQPGFGKLDNGTYGMHAAQSYHMKEAIIGAYPNQEIDCLKAVFTFGGLASVPNPTVALLAGRTLSFRWDDNSHLGNAGPEDTLIAIAYCKAQQAFEWNCKAKRSGSFATIAVPVQWSGTVYCWIALQSEFRNEAATSVFIGTVAL